MRFVGPAPPARPPPGQKAKRSTLSLPLRKRHGRPAVITGGRSYGVCAFCAPASGERVVAGPWVASPSTFGCWTHPASCRSLPAHFRSMTWAKALLLAQEKAPEFMVWALNSQSSSEERWTHSTTWRSREALPGLNLSHCTFLAFFLPSPLSSPNMSEG